MLSSQYSNASILGDNKAKSKSNKHIKAIVRRFLRLGI